VFLGVVRLVGFDAVGGDEGAVDDHEVAFAESDQGFVQARRPGSEYLDRLIDVAPGGRLGDPEAGAELPERLVLAQMRQGEQGAC